MHKTHHTGILYIGIPFSFHVKPSPGLNPQMKIERTPQNTALKRTAQRLTITPRQPISSPHYPTINTNIFTSGKYIFHVQTKFQIFFEYKRKAFKYFSFQAHM